MTVSYAGEVPNGSSFGCFWKILLKWRGSVYKLVWRELLAYLALYYSINLLYRYVLNDDQKIIFEKLRQYFGAQSESIPMSFVLGFYVSLVVKRWWEQYKLLPWPDTLALFISAAIPNNPKTADGTGEDKQETGRLMRRNIMRYSVLAYVITLMRISLRVKRRFPSWQHLVDAGLMLESEKKIFEIMDGKSPMSKYWMPLVWATNIINRARKENLIVSDHIVQTLLVELSDIRRRLGALIGYDTVCVPLVYTQVVTLVLYTYFIAALLGRQMIPKLGGDTSTKYEDADLYFPLFTALQFCFYVGWLKVAEVLINPFGEDDDDIELNWLIDRHIKASYMIVDEMHEEHPELLKDQYWDQVVPVDLPYTVASEHYRRSEPKGSAEHYKIKQSDAMYANIIPTKRLQSEDAYADYESVDTPMVERRKNWFSRQITRMGSVRSSSTAYSSGGVFKRNRQHSVYSSPEAGLVPNASGGGSAIGISTGAGGLQQHHHQSPNAPSSLPGSATSPTSALPQPPQKMSFYDKFVARKSLRNQRQLIKQNSKLNLNGAVLSAVPLKNRPRIPTPDVTKEGMEKENRFNLTPVVQTSHHQTNVPTGVALMTHQLATTPSMYPMSNHDMPVLGTLLLTPIKELESNSVNNTLHAGNPATAALAQSVLTPTLQAGGFGAVSLDLTGITNSPSLNRISLNNSTTQHIPTTMVFPTTMAPTFNNTTQSISQNDILSLAITRLPVSIALPSSSSPSSPSQPPQPPAQSTTAHQSNNIIITELPSMSQPHLTTLTQAGYTGATASQSDETDSMRVSSLLSRDNSIRTAGISGPLRDTNHFGRQSFKSSLDSHPHQEKSNVVSSSPASAPSTLSKSKPEQKTGEVYV